MKVVVSFQIIKRDGMPFISGENDLSFLDDAGIRSSIIALSDEVAKYVALAKIESHGSLSDDAGPQESPE